MSSCVHRQGRSEGAGHPAREGSEWQELPQGLREEDSWQHLALDFRYRLR